METQGGMVQFWYIFSRVGEGSCLVLETPLLGHSDLPTAFV